MRTESPVTPTADAALAATAMPAMRHGGRLRMSDRSARGCCAASASSRRCSGPGRSIGRSPSRCRRSRSRRPSARPGAIAPRGRVAAFFSGGVDSWGTVLDNPDLTDLIFVRGFDLAHEGAAGDALADEVEAPPAGGRGRSSGCRFTSSPPTCASSSDPELPWDVYFGCAVRRRRPLPRAALRPRADRRRLRLRGPGRASAPTWLVDQLWSTEELEIVDDGGRFSRMQRLERLVEHPVACAPSGLLGEPRPHLQLRSLPQVPDDADRAGGDRRARAGRPLPARARPRSGSLAESRSPTGLADALGRPARRGRGPPGAPDLEAAVAAAGREGKSRPRPAARPSAAGTSPARRRPGRREPDPLPRELATPPSSPRRRPQRRSPRRRSVAFLVGGYDGSGNFGDVLMLDAALELLAPLEPGLAGRCPCSSAASARTIPSSPQQMIRPPRHPVYFDPEGQGEDDLVPIPAAAGLALGGLLLLRRRLPQRPLGRPQAGDDAGRRGCAGGSRAARGPAGRLGPAGRSALDRRASRTEDASFLRAFELLGARDPRSGEILAGSARRSCPKAATTRSASSPACARPSRPATARLRVNLHFAEHDWVTDEPAAAARTSTPTCSPSSARHAGRPVVAQPLIAYLDPTGRRAAGGRAAGRRARRARDRGSGPLRPAPAGLNEVAAQMGEPPPSPLACSYHVALTSLMLGLPTLMVAHNPFYEQKAAGLLDAFGQPAEFAIRGDADPRSLRGAPRRDRARPCRRRQAAGPTGPRRAADAAPASRRRGRPLRPDRRRRGGGLERRRPAVGRRGGRRRPPGARGGGSRARGARNARPTPKCTPQPARPRWPSLTGSTSWRLTEPLRRLTEKARRERVSAGASRALSTDLGCEPGRALLHRARRRSRGAALVPRPKRCRRRAPTPPCRRS